MTVKHTTQTAASRYFSFNQLTPPFLVFNTTFDCLGCKHLSDWDLDYDENHWFACDLSEKYREEEYDECPHREPE